MPKNKIMMYFVKGSERIFLNTMSKRLKVCAGRIA